MNQNSENREREREVFSITIPKGSLLTLANIDAKAQKISTTRADLCFQAIEMYCRFDDKFLEVVGRYANNFNVPAWLLIQNMLLGKLARLDAESEIYDSTDENVLPEFICTSKGMLTGQNLYDMIKKNHVETLGKDLAKSLIEDERDGHVLDDGERAIVEKYSSKEELELRKRDSKLELLQIEKTTHELFIQGLIAKGLLKDKVINKELHAHVADIYKELNDGTITEEKAAIRVSLTNTILEKNLNEA